MDYRGQFQQDKYIHDTFFRDNRKGTFLDIGAHDGENLSNTYFFEKELNWNGICVEPRTDKVFDALVKKRSCICENIGLFSAKDTLEFFNYGVLTGVKSTYDSRHLERFNVQGSEKFQCITINDLLERHNILHFDLCSIDTEGSEYEILKVLDFEKYIIDIILVEDNYNDNHDLNKLMDEKGYKLHSRLAIDNVFVRGDYQY